MSDAIDLGYPNFTFNEYQLVAGSTAIYPGRGSFLGLMYTVGKLAGEAGEVSENTFKALRDDAVAPVVTVYDDGPVFMHECHARFEQISDERREKLKLELGDVLWYIAMASQELGFSLSDIANANIKKLAARKAKGTLRGSGSER